MYYQHHLDRRITGTQFWVSDKKSLKATGQEEKNKLFSTSLKFTESLKFQCEWNCKNYKNFQNLTFYLSQNPLVCYTDKFWGHIHFLPADSRPNNVLLTYNEDPRSWRRLIFNDYSIIATICTFCSTKIKWSEIFKSRTGSHVTCSCHHNSSRFTFPIFVHSWRFSVFHSLQSITLYILTKDPIHSLNLKLKDEIKVINIPRRIAYCLCFQGWMLRNGGCLPHPELAEHVNAWWQYSSETNYIGSNPSDNI